MTNEYILLSSFGLCVGLMLCCACIRYCKDRRQDIQEKINIKKFKKRLKRKNIIKPIIETTEILDEKIKNEKIKDEKENDFRKTEKNHYENYV